MAGVDEAGRGPLAGPVVAAAVVFIRHEPLPGLNDSKRLSASQREALFFYIARSAIIGVGVASERVIDRINIFQATRTAMRQAVLNLSCTPQLVLADGRIRLDIPMEQRSLVRGDGKSASIAAASIVAKVHRDALMRHLDGQYPEYGFAQHKGYGTPDHLERLRRIGPSPVHRRSFSPVRELVEPGVAEAESN